MTAQKAFETALNLINQREEDGEYILNIEDLRKNAVSYLNILTISLYELDCKIRGVACNIDNNTPEELESLDSALTLHKSLCGAAVPYGLAFMLLLEEEPERAEKFHLLYKEECARVERLCTKGRRHGIKEVY
ncbi:MAG: hypothetical protein IJO74_01310 [Clostridia bacterium]|nr:hypothetical protein [Clostridia bacterium]